jgi:hypothetical protein
MSPTPSARASRGSASWSQVKCCRYREASRVPIRTYRPPIFGPAVRLIELGLELPRALVHWLGNSSCLCSLVCKLPRRQVPEGRPGSLLVVTAPPRLDPIACVGHGLGSAGLRHAGAHPLRPRLEGPVRLGCELLNTPSGGLPEFALHRQAVVTCGRRRFREVPKAAPPVLGASACFARFGGSFRKFAASQLFK